MRELSMSYLVPRMIEMRMKGFRRIDLGQKWLGLHKIGLVHILLKQILVSSIEQLDEKVEHDQIEHQQHVLMNIQVVHKIVMVVRMIGMVGHMMN